MLKVGKVNNAPLKLRLREFFLESLNKPSKCGDVRLHISHILDEALFFPEEEVIGDCLD